MELVSILAVVVVFAECGRYVYSWKYYTQLCNGRLGTHSSSEHLAVPAAVYTGGLEEQLAAKRIIYCGNMFLIASARLDSGTNT